MQPNEEQAYESVQTSIEAHRTDVLKAMLDTLKKEWTKEEFMAFINKQREFGTLLHLVTKNNQADMVRLLLSYGADPTALDGNGDKPLVSGSPKNARTAFNDALFSAIAQHQISVMEKLVLSAVDTDVRDNPETLNTPLHWAVSFSNKEAITFLIEQGATIDSTNAKGITPLHEAVQLGNCEIVQQLIKLGANIHYPVQGTSELRGKSAIELAPPDSPMKSLLMRYAVAKDGLTIKTSSTELLNGHPSNGLNRSFSNKMGPVSPGAESALSLEEINAALPFVRAPVRPVITDNRLNWIWPPPKQMQQLEGPPFSLHHPWNISFVSSSALLHEILDIWDAHKPQFSLLGINPIIGNVKSNNPVIPEDEENRVICCIKDQLFPNKESYRLTVSSEKVNIVASDGNGLHNALSTLEQLITLCRSDGHLPAVHIEDSPSLRMRAVFLDVSPTGRVPLIDSLFSMIDAWRSVKINQIHLYSRVNSCAGLQWPWPYTQIEVISLDRYCKDRGIELVPALDVEGDVVDYQQLQTFIGTTRPCFPSTKFFHAGPNLTSLLVDSCRGCLNYSDMTWLLCANSLREKKINPSFDPGCILVEYGFQADYNFQEKSQTAWEESASLAFCAGTASWDCLSSYPEAAAANIMNAVQAAVERGSLGSIAATWTDAVALGSLHFAWPGWILQAGLAWNHSVHWDFIQQSLGDLVSMWILNEPLDRRSSIGTAIVEMGRLETWLLRHARGELQLHNGFEPVSVPPSLPPSEGSIHYRLLLDPDNINVDNLSMECVVRAIRHSKRWHKVLSDAAVVEGRYPFTKSAVQQALLTADFLLLACRILRGILTIGSNPNSNMGVAAINLGVINLTPTLRTDAANRLLSLTERFQHLWAQQYQTPSNGLNNIVGALNNSIQRLLSNVDTTDM